MVTMATTLIIIGIIEIIAGFIAALFAVEITTNELIPIALIVVGFVNGILFCAFGKLIRLLENMVSNQNKIIKKLIPNDNNYEDSETPK